MMVVAYPLISVETKIAVDQVGYLSTRMRKMESVKKGGIGPKNS